MAEWLRDFLGEITRFLIAIAIIGGNLAILYFTLVKGVLNESKELQIMVVNASGTSVGLVLAYYFGSSAGSAAKDKVIADTTKKL